MSGCGFLVMDPSPLREEKSRSKKLPADTVYFEVSPSHKVMKKAPTAEEVSVLRLVHFTHCPKIDFDKVKLGSECRRILRVLNPKDVTQELRRDAPDRIT